MTDTDVTIDEQLPTATGKFTDLRAAIARAVSASLPADKHGAVFAIADTDTKTLRFGTVIRVNDQWQVLGDLSSDVHGQHVTGRIMVAGTW